jgi:hypothetical protein
MHTSIVLKRDDAQRLYDLLKATGCFDDFAETLDYCLNDLKQFEVAVITTVDLAKKIKNFLATQQPDHAGAYHAVQRAIEFPHFDDA